MKSLTSNEVNFLVYRYLQESGFNHASFTFGTESHVHSTKIDGSAVPAGSLVTFLQKGIQYMEIEHRIKAGENMEIKYDSPLQLLYPQVPKEKLVVAEKQTSTKTKKRSSSKSVKTEDVVNIEEKDVTELKGHRQEVFICAFSPTNPLQLASGSADFTARIWTLPKGPCGEKSKNVESIELSHGKGESERHDVTTLDWSRDGTTLATGSYDHKVRIWSNEGELKKELAKHTEAIFSLKWNKNNRYLLSGSVDTTAIVWDVEAGKMKQQYKGHMKPALDVDWRNEEVFATCSTDKMIFINKVGEEKPIKVFNGHTDEVNGIRWSPDGELLASCSDDSTAKIWSLNADSPIFSFEEHQKEIYTIKWSPTGPKSKNPNRPLLLATASFDAKIKLWDIKTGECVHTLDGHSEAVYSIAFSPDGKYMASGSFDRRLNIWDVDTGKRIKSFLGKGAIFEVCWNKTGDKVAACFSNSISQEYTVCTMDI